MGVAGVEGPRCGCGCGYDLSGLAGPPWVCPECSASWDSLPTPLRGAPPGARRMLGYGAAATAGGMIAMLWLPDHGPWIGGCVMGLGMLSVAGGMARLGGDEGPGRRFRWAGAVSGFAVGLFLAAVLAFAVGFLLMVIMDMRGNF